MIGRTLSHYRITARLGAGAMGEVYRAADAKLGRDVALKVLSAEMAADPERLERFQREARAVAALNHPHIVTIFAVEEADGVHFLTMDLVEGQSLERLIPKAGLPLERLLEIAAPLDAHNKFHLAEAFGLAGDTDRALELLEQAVDQGFYPYPFIARHCPFLAPLRPLSRFAGILATAQERADAFRKREEELGPVK